MAFPGPIEAVGAPSAATDQNSDDNNNTNDDDNSWEELDSAAVAAAMGFSSFGAQAPPNKKRRFNPRADNAIVATSAASGANSVQLPANTRMRLPPPRSETGAEQKPEPAPAAEAHIDQREGEEGGAKDSTDTGSKDTESTRDSVDQTENGSLALSNDNDDPGPQYIDTSRPVGEIRQHLVSDHGQDATTQAHIDAIVGAGNATYGVPLQQQLPLAPSLGQLDGSSMSTSQQPDGIRGPDRHGFRAALMPPSGAGRVGAARGQSGGGVDGSADAQHARGQARGRRDWWSDYYDPSSNSNPWAELEARRGLPASGGSWLSPSPQQVPVHASRPS